MDLFYGVVSFLAVGAGVGLDRDSLSHRFALELNAMGIVDQPVKDRIGQSRIPDEECIILCPHATLSWIVMSDFLSILFDDFPDWIVIPRRFVEESCFARIAFVDHPF